MRRALVLAAIVVLVGGAGVYAFRQELGLSASHAAPEAGGRRGARGRGGEGGPVSVLTEPARYADVPVVLEAVGTAQALNTVTVRSQVDGKLMELAFREGQDVKKGDVIARIDPTIYQAQYDQAVAKKAQDEANLANARVDLDRYANLAKTNYGSKQQADTQRASVAQLEAQAKSDQGAIDNAKAYLDYTTIRAPIDGRTGIRLVDQGNIVHASDTTGLVVITQLQPITILFNLAQQNLRAVNAAAAAGPLAVDALESDNRATLDSGRLEVVDNQVDQTTGTVKLKATFPNDRLQLWPGSFVNVRLTVDVTRHAVTVPTASVQRGPNGAFVYGVADEKAVLKPVTVARQTETVAVVTSGVTPPERVITTGFARLTDGDRVHVADAEQPAPGAAAPARRMRPDGESETPGRERRRRREGAEAGPSGSAPATAAQAPPGAAPGPAAANAAPADPASTGPDGAPRDPARRRQRQEGRQGDRQDARAGTP